MPNTQEFLTPATLGHYATSVIAVSAVSHAIECLTKSHHPLLTFIIAMIIAYVTAGAGGTLTAVPWRDIPKQSFFSALLAWILPSLNASILFLAALGSSQIL